MSRYSIRNYNFLLVIVSVALSVYGIIVIGSAKESVQSHQIQGFILGAGVMLAVSFVSYRFILKFGWVYYAMAVGLLLLVEFFGESVNNAKRWLVVAGIQIQPSEAAKILLILFLAAFISKREEKLNSVPVLVTLIVLVGIPVLIVYVWLQKHIIKGLTAGAVKG